jgi:arylsulfatase A-like enzyme
MTRSWRTSLVLATVPALFALTGAPAAKAQQKKPNILILWGDDIGYWNLSAYNQGMMGYKTPNIDRVAHEGALFTDWYAQQSCTAGRAAFITGQSPIRTGLTKVGLPGAQEGLQKKDPTIAELLKPLGYTTGQFGKNHLGDRNDYLPTVHGFDVFFGNLYHLNAEQEPEHPDYPTAVPSEIWPPRCIALRGDRYRRSCATRPTIWSVGQTDVRGHRPAHDKTNGDNRRRTN